MQMRSIFSVVAVSDFGKGLVVDERCQATLFVVYLFFSIRLYLEDHHQSPLWKRNPSHLLSSTVPYVHFKPMQLSQV